MRLLERKKKLKKVFACSDGFKSRRCYSSYKSFFSAPSMTVGQEACIQTASAGYGTQHREDSTSIL
jgi:hypothetical protein